MLTVLGGLAEFERHLILTRTAEDRKRAQVRGVSLPARGCSLVILLSPVGRCGHYAIGPRNLQTGNRTLPAKVWVSYPRRVLHSSLLNRTTEVPTPRRDFFLGQTGTSLDGV
jgi:hypothetical protein